MIVQRASIQRSRSATAAGSGRDSDTSTLSRALGSRVIVGGCVPAQAPDEMTVGRGETLRCGVNRSLGGRAWWFLSATLLWLALAACSAAPAATAEPTPRSTPVSTAAGRSNTEKEAEIRAGIIDVYGSKPQPAWYKDLHLVSGEIDLALDSTSLFVAATSARHADEMCRDIAAAPYDANGELIGFRHVHIQVGPDIVADCDIAD